jgi:6-phosphogluconolactonase
MPIGFYIGTYTGHGSDGIYYSRLDPSTGRLDKPILAAKTDNPSFIALHPSGKYLYAVDETGTGEVCAFAVDPHTAGLTAINRRPSHGSYPCHLSIDRTGACLLVANYGTGTFAAYPIGPDGAIAPAGSMPHDTGHGPVADRQEGPHAHGIWPMPLSPTPVGWSRNALGCDLGTDQLRIFHLDPIGGHLTPANPPFLPLPPGTGPRHIAFSHDARFLYLIAELDNTISVLTTQKLEFHIIQSLPTLPPDFAAKNKAAEIALHPKADVLYATNRGADDLVTFAIDPATGDLRELARTPTGGKSPRQFAVDPTGQWLLVANEDSSSITTFRIDPASKIPKRFGDAMNLSSPVCILFA